MEAFERLITIMETLRAPGGCPWDAEQTHQSLAKNMIEEAYELVDAIDRDEPECIMEELGDVLLQVVFHSTLAKEVNRFEISDVIHTLCDKLVYRHPHVFGNGRADDARAVIRNWDRLKGEENGKQARESLLSGIPESMPALPYALKIQSAASRVGFDWETAEDVYEKIDEELTELSDAVKQGNEAEIPGEIGDLIFSLVNLSRKLDVDPESALRGSNRKFVRRFQMMEKSARAAGKALSEMPMDEKERIWQAAKAAAPG